MDLAIKLLISGLPDSFHYLSNYSVSCENAQKSYNLTTSQRLSYTTKSRSPIQGQIEKFIK